MGLGRRDVVFLAVVLGGTGIMGAGLVHSTGTPSSQTPKPLAVRSDLRTIVEDVDRSFGDRWEEQKLAPAAPASDLAVMRRLALALCGSLPSLEEIRRFESRSKELRVAAWVDDLLADRRCADYLAERFARAFVGTEDGPFLLYRRRRFIAWLSDALFDNRPYNAIVTELIADRGLWTDHPATNFVSVTFDPEAGSPTPDRLAARVARAFLGARIDCAQCHDHPFQPWKQADFRGLAAFFGGVDPICAAFMTVQTNTSPPTTRPNSRSRLSRTCRFVPSCCPPRETLVSSLPPGLSTRGTRTSAVRPSTACGLYCLADRWPSLLTTSAPPESCIRLWAGSPTISLRMATTCIASFAPSCPLRFLVSTAPSPTARRSARGRVGRLPADPPAARTGRRSALSMCVAHNARSALALVYPYDDVHGPQRFRPPLWRYGRRRV